MQNAQREIEQFKAKLEDESLVQKALRDIDEDILTLRCPNRECKNVCAPVLGSHARGGECLAHLPSMQDTFL